MLAAKIPYPRQQTDWWAGPATTCEVVLQLIDDAISNAADVRALSGAGEMEPAQAGGLDEATRARIASSASRYPAVPRPTITSSAMSEM